MCSNDFELFARRHARSRLPLDSNGYRSILHDVYVLVFSTRKAGASAVLVALSLDHKLAAAACRFGHANSALQSGEIAHPCIRDRCVYLNAAGRVEVVDVASSRQLVPGCVAFFRHCRASLTHHLERRLQCGDE